MKHLLARYHRLFLLVILAFAFFTRIYQLNLPDKYVFDEVYHAVTAKLISRNDPWAYEWWNPPIESNTAVDWLHPPLAKYTQAIGIRIFGETTVGWRISSVIFGVLVVFATYKLALVLFNQQTIALLSALLASLDGLLLVQSRVAMNDIHVTFFILLTCICAIRYFRAKHLWLGIDAQSRHWRSTVFWSVATGVSAGLAMGSKWSGLFALGLVGLGEVGTWIWFWNKYKKFHLSHLKLLIINAVLLGILPFALYVLSYIHMFTTGHSLFCHSQVHIPGQCYYEEIKIGNTTLFTGYLSHFYELHRQIWLYQTNLTATHPYQSRPWQWFLDARPVWYSVDYYDTNLISNIYAFGNPVLFWLGDVAIIGLVLYLLLIFLLKRTLNPTLLFLLVAYAIVWLPWTRSPRIMFFYHYTPAVPLLCIALAFALWLLWGLRKGHEIIRPLIVLCCVAILGTFILWYPQWTGLPVSRSWAETIYFRIPSWK